MGLAVIIVGNTGDVVQLGTMIPCPGFFAIVAMLVWNQVKQAREKGWSRHQTFRLLALACFTIGALNDFFVVSGVLDHVTLLSVGFVFGMFSFTLDFDEVIIGTYRERDYLRENLEQEVDRKTLELQNKKADLEQALVTLRQTQSELIQNAKMASLGTLSAGIAHEINNSLNYVNGAFQPLEKIVQKSDFSGREKAQKMLKIIDEGLKLTFEIMNSLRTYSGLNHAKLKDYKVEDLMLSVNTILKRRIPDNIELSMNVPAGMIVITNGAVLNQVLMNLITNAIDAMPEGGTIKLSAEEERGGVALSVDDNGVGMPEAVLVRIFEPFYTTKDVGSGTGLGLHICKSEIERLGGTITVESAPNIGTKFKVFLPQQAQNLKEAA